MHALAPPENGTKLSLSHSPMNLSGLKLNGSSQYRAVWLSVNHLTRSAGYKVSLTIIMKSSDINDDLAPGTDRKHSCLTCSISDDESSVLGTVLRNDMCLGLSSTEGLWQLRDLRDQNLPTGTSSVFRIMCCIDRNLGIGTDTPISLREAYAATRSSLGMSSLVCEHSQIWYPKRRQPGIFTGMRPSGRTLWICWYNASCSS